MALRVATLLVLVATLSASYCGGGQFHIRSTLAFWVPLFACAPCPLNEKQEVHRLNEKQKVHRPKNI